MECSVHPGVPALDRCAGCAESFCNNCLVDIGGQFYCGSCKVLAVQGKAPAVAPTQTCPEASEALKMALIGLICFGVILGPIAISKAIQAKKRIATDPTMGGSGMATAALIIGIIALLGWCVGVYAQISQLN